MIRALLIAAAVAMSSAAVGQESATPDRPQWWRPPDPAPVVVNRPVIVKRPIVVRKVVVRRVHRRRCFLVFCR